METRKPTQEEIKRAEMDEAVAKALQPVLSKGGEPGDVIQAKSQPGGKVIVTVFTADQLN